MRFIKAPGGGSTVAIDDDGAEVVAAASRLNFTSGLDVADAGSGEVTVSIAATSQVWMPLTTVVGGVPELVWDADDSLIPTEVPI